ncbi:MAG TPA: Uma2 family endonuclease [Vitreimonas sp.]|uniref:Uma2 family endonuclease n=1 Tax=Vitreimonas sp. TaxID=3069702 RepID=UPI002D547615|nr:Uma2 family endonuclease [Vitreimonas sp.]HYD89018.1 Uma2 family endonuclease [Vitreimonas sp.]
MTDLAPAPVRMTGTEFDRLMEGGGSAALGRIELRRGVLVQMSPEYLPHGRFKAWLFKTLDAAIAAARSPYAIDIEVTVRFPGRFRPSPDVTVWDGGPLKGPIPGEKARLCVEVSDDTFADDIGAKRIEYAEAGLPEYWVLDVNARAVHRFWQPHEGDYAKRDIIRAGEALTSATLAGIALAFDPPVVGV